MACQGDDAPQWARERLRKYGKCPDAGPTRLSDMVFDEISIVPRGANQDAHIVTVKDDGVPAVPIWRFDSYRFLGEGLAELRRQETIVKGDDPGMDSPDAGIESPSLPMIKAGYPGLVAKALEDDPAAYDEQYGVAGWWGVADDDVAKDLGELAQVVKLAKSHREQDFAATPWED